MMTKKKNIPNHSEAENNLILSDPSEEARNKEFLAMLSHPDVDSVRKSILSENYYLGDGLEDLNQVLMMAVDDALKNYNPAKGEKVACVIQKMRWAAKQYLCQQHSIVISKDDYAMIKKVRAYFEGNRTATVADCAKALGVKPATVLTYMQNADGSSLSKPVGSDESITLEDIIADEKEDSCEPESYAFKPYLKDAMDKCLSEKDRFIVMHYFAMGCERMSSEELAEVFSVSKTAIINRKDRALKKLQDYLLSLPEARRISE